MTLVLNSLFPVIFLLAAGMVLKHYQLTSELFLKTSDRLVYYIFFPALLFWKIGGAQTSGDFNLDYSLIAIAVTVAAAIISLVLIHLFKISDFKAGSFSQSCYRFNTYIGMAVIINAFGNEGVRYFGVLISLVIPVINVMAVSTLIWYSGKRISAGERVWLSGKALISNPLILASVAGILYAGSVNSFAPFVENTLRLMTSVTLPLALLSIGGALTTRGLKQHFGLSALASLSKLLLMPLAGYLLLKYFNVTGLPFRVGLIFLAQPTATSIYILSSQLNSDTELASAAIALSTALSFISLSMALII